MKVKEDPELVASEVEEQLRAQHTNALLMMAADTSCSEIVREVLRHSLQGLSAPSQLRNLKFKDCDASKTYDVHALALKAEKGRLNTLSTICYSNFSIHM